jgi:DNA-binding NtrC family response regulator
MAKGRILVVDDEANARNALAEILRDEGFAVETAADGFKALPKLRDFGPEVVLTDLKMPGMDGVELLGKVHEHDPEVGVVLMTAFGAVDTAVKAMREGAADYLTKPLNADALLVVLARTLERYRLRQETRQLRERLEERFSFSNIIGNSPEIQRVFKTVQQIASSRATVLVTGESGTGKELIAAAIHQNSPRKAGPFVKLHCAALAESLLESELFGHERGAFTGADRRREGRFELANGGTLFLDEIGEITPAVQVKLLRVLQEREFERVGGNQTVQTDVRVITATNRDLKEMVERGLFREDLFYRLNVVNLHMPSLRERSSDIAPLADHFMRRFARENDKRVTTFADAALSRLLNYDWPGNIRELENVIERAVVLTDSETIDASHLPPEMTPTSKESPGPRIPGWSLGDIERFAILKTLEDQGGSTSKAADVLGISVRKIQYKLQEYGASPKSEQPVIERA